MDADVIIVGAGPTGLMLAGEGLLDRVEAAGGRPIGDLRLELMP